MLTLITTLTGRPRGRTQWIENGVVANLAYSRYWAREKGRRGESGLRACRIDLSAGYAMTASITFP